MNIPIPAAIIIETNTPIYIDNHHKVILRANEKERKLS